MEEDEREWKEWKKHLAEFHHIYGIQVSSFKLFSKAIKARVKFPIFTITGGRGWTFHFYIIRENFTPDQITYHIIDLWSVKKWKTGKNEQTYQSTVIWLRIMNRQVAHTSIQKMAITVVGEVWTKFGQSQIQPPFQDLAPGWKQPSPDN